MRFMSYDVYALGNAIVDLQVRVPDTLLESLGVDKGIMTLVEADQQAQLLRGLDGHPVHRSSGGSACNTVVGLADLGGKAAFAGKVGEDELGRFYLDELKDLGVACGVDPTFGATGTSVVLITEDAQRTMLTHLGASCRLITDDVDVYEIAKAEYVYVEGYLFSDPGTREAAERAIHLAKEEGVKVALTVSDPFLISLCKDVFWSLIRGPVDLLFCNLQEARALTDLEDPVACAQAIHQHAANVCLTLGKDGSIVMHGGESFPVEGVTVDAVDTTGAGDMYAAGVLYGITHGMTWKQAGHLGSHAAARIVGQLGARLEKPFTPEEIAALLR
jgi:sugar/nucleoside kinase (ribokinase family)